VPYSPQSTATYIAFNKPYGVLCQFTQPDNSEKRTLSEFGFPKNVYPLGRLDYDSEGLLLLSDDNKLNHQLLDPFFAHKRTYLVQVENVPSQDALGELQRGIYIEGYLTKPCKAKLLATEPALPERSHPIRVRKHIPTAWLELTLTEGKNRQVRKMTAKIGCPTLRLVRAAIGALRIPDLGLQSGEWRKLTVPELNLALSIL
jgi:23S rRNA pseudouridine2457 synthase